MKIELTELPSFTSKEGEASMKKKYFSACHLNSMMNPQ
jgi:hypothetical protein